MGGLRFGTFMEKFAVKRGLIKQIGAGGLSQLGAKYFDDITANAEGGFTAEKGILSRVQADYDGDGNLVVEVVQMRGDDLNEFLSAEGGREAAMASRAAWSSFLDEATGYSPKQRGDKAKENAKKISKSKSAIKMANKFMEMSSNVSAETRAQAEELMVEIQAKLDEGNATRAMSLSDKLTKLVES